MNALVRRLTRHGATDNAWRVVSDHRQLHDDVERRLMALSGTRRDDAA